jgi:hypothetical protein
MGVLERGGLKAGNLCDSWVLRARCRSSKLNISGEMEGLGRRA